VRKGVRAPKGPRPRFLLRQSFARYRPGIGAAGYGISGSPVEGPRESDTGSAAV